MQSPVSPGDVTVRVREVGGSNPLAPTPLCASHNRRPHGYLKPPNHAASAYIDTSTSRALWRYLTSRHDACPDDPLFANHLGRPLTRDVLRHLIRRLGERAGISNANVHRFRHTFAINFLRNGGNAYTLQRLLGYCTMTMTKIYLALSAQDDSHNHRHASPVANWRL